MRPISDAEAAEMLRLNAEPPAATDRLQRAVTQWRAGRDDEGRDWVQVAASRRRPVVTLGKHYETLTHPVVYVTSVGSPVGTALLLGDGAEADDVLPGLLDLTGTVSDGVWSWDGEGDVRDDRRNAVRLVQLLDDAAVYDWQRADYLGDAE